MYHLPSARDWSKLEEASSAWVRWVPTEAIDILSEVAVKIPQLEELSILVTENSHRYLKDHVLPVMPNLKYLFLISSDIEGDTNFRGYQANELDRLFCCTKDILGTNRRSVLTRKDFQPLQLVGCCTHFYTCCDAEPDSFTFGVNHHDTNRRRAVAYYQVLDVTNVERYNFAQGLRAVKYCDSGKSTFNMFRLFML